MNLPNDGQSGEPAVDWRSIDQLLEKEDYEQVAHSLHQTQITHEKNGDLTTADTLATLRQIFLLCHDCQASMAWYRQASQENELRERKLRQQAQSILERLNGNATTRNDDSHSGKPPIVAPPNSGQRKEGQNSQEFEPPGQTVRVPTAIPTEAQNRQQPTLDIYCLGVFRVYQNGQPVDEWQSAKGLSIFKYLITNRERPVAKEVLMDLFWPEAGPEAARNNLNVAIYGLRRALRKGYAEKSHVLFQNNSYLIHPEIQIWVDIEEFEKNVQMGRTFKEEGAVAEMVRSYRAADAIYRGEFLAEDRYEDWLMPRRQRIQDDYLSLLNQLSSHYLHQHDYDSCIFITSKTLGIDRCQEKSHRRLMRCYSRHGQHHMALRQYHLCVEALAHDLDVEPDAETVALYEQIRRRHSV